MTIAEAVAEIDRLRAENRWLSGQVEILRLAVLVHARSVEILRSELHTARAAASR